MRLAGWTVTFVPSAAQWLTPVQVSGGYMLTTDRRSVSSARAEEERRARLPLTQRARLAELEHQGWQLRCIRSAPPLVVVASPKNRLAVLTAEGRLAEPMGVTLRQR